MELYAERTALIVVDMQNAFCKFEGSAARLGFDIRQCISAIDFFNQYLIPRLIHSKAQDIKPGTNIGHSGGREYMHSLSHDYLNIRNPDYIGKHSGGSYLSTCTVLFDDHGMLLISFRGDHYDVIASL